MELEPLLIPILIDSSTNFTCDLCSDSSMCKICGEINQFLTTDCVDCYTGSDMDITTKLLKLECTNSITIIPGDFDSVQEK